jgi:predicted ester cyclase
MDRRSLLAGLTLSVATATAARAGAPGNVAQAFAAALSAHDLNEFAALFADDYAQHQTSAAVPPPPAGLSAKQATMNYFAARLAALPDLQVTADPVVLGDSMVAANFTYTGTHMAAYFGVPPSGRRITFNSCDILAVRGGLIVAHWGAADIAGLLKQLHG